MTQLYCLYHADPDYGAAVGDPLLAVVRAQDERDAINKNRHVEAPTGLIAIPHSENSFNPFYSQDQVSSPSLKTDSKLNRS